MFTGQKSTKHSQKNRKKNQKQKIFKSFYKKPTLSENEKQIKVPS